MAFDGVKEEFEKPIIAGLTMKYLDPVISGRQGERRSRGAVLPGVPDYPSRVWPTRSGSARSSSSGAGTRNE